MPRPLSLVVAPPCQYVGHALVHLALPPWTKMKSPVPTYRPQGLRTPTWRPSAQWQSPPAATCPSDDVLPQATIGGLRPMPHSGCSAASCDLPGLLPPVALQMPRSVGVLHKAQVHRHPSCLVLLRMMIPQQPRRHSQRPPLWPTASEWNQRAPLHIFSAQLIAAAAASASALHSAYQHCPPSQSDLCPPVK